MLQKSETRAKMRSILGFSFSRKSIKEFPAKRLALVEQMVGRRAVLLFK